MREACTQDQPRGQYTLILANGVMVESKNRGVDIDALRASVLALDLGKIETMRRLEKS